MWIDRNIVGWCNNCNVPILDAKRCGICSRQSKKLNLRFKGEVRPLFPIEKKMIGGLVTEFFSDKSLSDLHEDSLWFFNETSRTEFKGDVIIDGKVLFEVFYNALIRTWRIKPYKDFLKYLNPQRRVIRLHDFLSPLIRECKGVYAPWIKNIIPPAFLDEYVILDTGDVKGVGKVIFNSLHTENRKVIEVLDSAFISRKSKLRGSHLKEVIQANSYILEEREEEARKKIEYALKKLNRPLIVSFSGGKDSSVAANICLEFDSSVPIVFLDTGIEFPETIDFFYSFAKELHLKDNLVKVSSSYDFFKLWKVFGPPSRRLRWCCKTQKFSPMNEFITTSYPEGVLSVLAVRKHESLLRSKSSLIEKNRWIPQQAILYPIKDWGLLDVWLYIFWKKIPYNELYERGIPRVGCWPCPFQSQCIFNLMENTHPHLIRILHSHLQRWANRHGFSKEWIMNGSWRLRNNELTKEKVGYTESCTEGKPMNHFVLDGGIGNRIRKLLPILTDQFERHYVDGKSVICIPKNVSQKKLRILIEKAINCKKCGVCTEICPSGALYLDKNGICVDVSKCHKCYACLEEPCMVSKYTLKKKVIAM